MWLCSHVCYCTNFSSFFFSLPCTFSIVVLVVSIKMHRSLSLCPSLYLSYAFLTSISITFFLSLFFSYQTMNRACVRVFVCVNIYRYKSQATNKYPASFCQLILHFIWDFRKLNFIASHFPSTYTALAHTTAFGPPPIYVYLYHYMDKNNQSNVCRLRIMIYELNYLSVGLSVCLIWWYQNHIHNRQMTF